MSQPLGPWALQAKAHWAEHRPKMYRSLERQGRLHEVLVAARDKTIQETMELENAGLDPESAFQAVREKYLFPPTEEDQPDWSPPT